MKKILIFMILLFSGIVFVSAAEAQTQPNKKSAERQARKQIEKMRDSLAYLDAVWALEHRDFVFEARMLYFKRGRSAIANPTTNFIALSGDEAVVQISPFNGGGANGVGGVTVEGRVNNVTMTTDKRGTIYFSMNVNGSRISARIDISLPKGSKDASVEVLPNLHSERISLWGELLPSKSSSVFKGRSF